MYIVVLKVNNKSTFGPRQFQYYIVLMKITILTNCPIYAYNVSLHTSKPETLEFEEYITMARPISLYNLIIIKHYWSILKEKIHEGDVHLLL